MKAHKLGDNMKDDTRLALLEQTIVDPRIEPYTLLAKGLPKWDELEKAIDVAIKNPQLLNELHPEDAIILVELLELISANRIRYSPKLAVYRYEPKAARNLDVVILGISQYPEVNELIQTLRGIGMSN